MGSLRVDYEALDGLARRLTALKGDFETLGRRVDDYRPAVGSPRIADRLEAFASNWSDARAELALQLERLAAHASGAAAAYRELEGEVATGFTSFEGPE